MKTQNRPLEIVSRPGEFSVKVSCLLEGSYRLLSQSIASRDVFEGDFWGESVVEFSHGLCATSAERDDASCAVRNCRGDGGRSSEVGMQVQASKHLTLLRSKATVVSGEEKASQETSGMKQRDERKRTTADASK